MIATSSRLRAESDDESDSPGGDGADSAIAAANAGMPPSPLQHYQVNILVDQGDRQHAPCVVEPNPTYYNLLGRLEYGSHMGNLFTDFTLIKPGAIHRANGGFLIIHARELLSAPRAWEGLKRALRTASVTIENLSDPQQSVALAASLKPEPIPLRVKVILVGELGLWDSLNDADPDFKELFKVRADFGPEMPRNPDTERYYAEFVGDATRALNLPPLTAAAIARIVEEGSRMAEDQMKLTTSLTSLRDLVIEASYWAREEDVIDATHVSLAIQTRRRRVSMLAERFEEQVHLGTIMLATSGTAIGQINALSMASVLGEDFGRPMRVTARTAPGLGGIVDIEIESRMSGPVHTKGVLTLAGYLAGQYGQEQPLSLAATIA
ncbi:MAG TPA: ATP-binding protein, partial [Ktedonobacterales bacterium]|nr:ATP-binding protein [Ktedonobacterales bacterium]